MSHELEQFKDGSASFVSAREVPWHNLGTVVVEGRSFSAVAFDVVEWFDALPITHWLSRPPVGWTPV